jgi:hypothetical protein
VKELPTAVRAYYQLDQSYGENLWPRHGTSIALSSTPEVNNMRLSHVLFGVLLAGSLAATPALAGQRGPHPAPIPVPMHATASTHPANSTAHPAPIPVPQKIAVNPALVTRLQPLLPAGVTLAAAATGFKNQGQFIATLHVSQNLKIPFAQLKAEMTGADHDSLGQAIHELQPTANARAAAKTGEREARADLKATRPASTDTDKDR